MLPFVSLLILICIPRGSALDSCSCFNDVPQKLADAHDVMEELNASTMIAYLNESGNMDETRNYIYTYFVDSFNLFYSLYDNIKEEYFWDSGCKLRWPIGWYLAHIASFYNNKFRMNNIINRTGNEMYKYYDYLFAQGTDDMDWNDFVPQYSTSYWPDVQDIKIYCNDTRDMIINLISTASLPSLPINKSMPIWWSILMGIEHERIHLETSAMLIRQFPLNKCKENINAIWSNEYDINISSIPPINELIHVKGGQITYGRDSDLLYFNNSHFFGWDVEYGQYTVNVSDFSASKYMVSNYEYYEFYKDNGYKNKQFWSDDGWKWIQETNTIHPRFWILQSYKSNETETFKLRNIFSEIDIEYAWNRPIITNHYEAEAFILWKSQKLNKNLRLITEDEWYLLRGLSDKYGKYNIREWHEWMNPFPANTNFYYFSSEAPINLFEYGATGFFDIVGNVHHHTLSIYHPFNNYEVDPLYVDFSTPFFNDSYFLMKGGSYLSSGNMAMIYNRCQWFRSHYFQATGIRYVESSKIDKNALNKDKQTTNQYFLNTDESDQVCNEYIHFQYTLNDHNNNYREIVIDIIRKYIDDISIINNVLDIGCNVGGVTYELAKYFKNIIGIDDRARFIGIANKMQQNHKLQYFMKNKFGETEDYSVSLYQLEMENITDRVRFIHDTNLQFILYHDNNNKYDMIIGHNMFERYYNDLKTLKESNNTLSNMLNENGIIILFEDYSWNKEENILNIMDEMNEILGTDMILYDQFDIDIIRQKYESSRISQHFLIDCTIWRR